MSSSKVFKQDSHFTPTPLVRRRIEPAVKNERSPGSDTTAPGFTGQASAAESMLLSPAEEVFEAAPAIDLEAVRREAYNQGMIDLAAEQQMELHQTIAAFAEACQQIDNLRATLLQQSRGDLINLIILLTKKIIGQEMSTSRGVIAATLQLALEQAIESEEYHVTLHPADLACAEAKVPELVTAVRGLQRIVLRTDDSMTRGGCLLESAVCTVDATIETQLDSMRELLTEQPLLASAVEAALPLPKNEETEPPTAS